MEADRCAHGQVYSRTIMFSVLIYAFYAAFKTKSPTGRIAMTSEHDENQAELDCEVTVLDGSWMTCDMIEEAPED